MTARVTHDFSHGNYRFCHFVRLSKHANATRDLKFNKLLTTTKEIIILHGELGGGFYKLVPFFHFH